MRATLPGSGLALLQLLPPGSAWTLHASMALLVHLKTVSELRGKGDRIAKVTFRGREAPVLGGPQLCWGGWRGKVLAGLGQGGFSCHLPLARMALVVSGKSVPPVFSRPHLCLSPPVLADMPVPGAVHSPLTARGPGGAEVRTLSRGSGGPRAAGSPALQSFPRSPLPLSLQEVGFLGHRVGVGFAGWKTQGGS